MTVKSWIFVAAALTACKTTPDNTELKHEFGVGKRDGDRNSCDQSTIESVDNEIDAYLRKMFLHLAKTSPHLFKGDLAPEKVCVYVNNKGSDNATAYCDHNRIVVNAGVLRKVESDAELAGILAHELSHLALHFNHKKSIPPVVLADPKWPEFRTDYDVKKTKILAEIKRLDQEQQKLSLERAKSLSCMQKDRTDATNSALLNVYRGQVAFNELLATSKMRENDYRKFWKRIADFPKLDAKDSAGKTIIEAEPTYKRATMQPTAPENLAKAEQGLADLNGKIQALLQVLAKDNGTCYQSYRQTTDAGPALMAEHNKATQAKYALESEFDRFILTRAGDQGYNWEEQEADEAGYEMYLRAGFKPESFVAYPRRNLGEAGWNNCMENHVQKGIEPPRGASSHPMDCWRAYDILYIEPRVHADNYAPLLKEATIETLFPGELATAKDRAKRLLN